MGLTFAAAISGVFSLIIVGKWLLFGSDLWYEIVETVLTGAAPVGFLIGVVFSGGLALFGRSRRFAEMSIWGFVAGGAVAGFLLRFSFIQLAWPDVLLDGHISTLLGAGSAAGIFALARRADAEKVIEGEEGRLLNPERE